MAKTKMICPFLGGPCKECAFYRGRHYYLCYCRKYRGYIEDQGEIKANVPGYQTNQFEMPAVLSVKTFDPFAIPQRDIK